MKLFKILSRKVEIRNQSIFQNRSHCGYWKDFLFGKHLMWTSWISVFQCLLQAFLPSEVCWVRRCSTGPAQPRSPLQAPCGISLYAGVLSSCGAVGRCFGTSTSPLPRCLAPRHLPNGAQEGNLFWVTLSRLFLVLWNADGYSSLYLYVSMGIQGIHCALLLCVFYGNVT